MVDTNEIATTSNFGSISPNCSNGKVLLHSPSPSTKMSASNKTVKFKVNNSNTNSNDSIKKQQQLPLVENGKDHAELESLSVAEQQAAQAGGYHQMRLPDGQMVLLLPPHYVQLAAALGLNSQPMIDQITTSTDFESLIEMNRRAQILQNHVERSQDHLMLNAENNGAADSAYWEHYKKSIATLTSMSEKLESSISTQFNNNNSNSTNNNNNESKIEVTQMEIDEPATLNDLSEGKKTLIDLDHKMDEDCGSGGGYKATPQQSSPTSSYEENQNNQHLLNENVESRGSNGSEDSMWRPW